MHKKGISLNSVEKSLSHSADKIRWRTLLCFERILVSKSFKQRRGKLNGLVENCIISQDRKISPGNHYVFQKIPGREKYFTHKRGGITIFCRSFCLTVPKNFIGEQFGVSKKIFYRKFSCIGGGASRFCRIFLSQRTETKNFVKEPFCFPEIFWYRKKLMDKRGLIANFSRNFYVILNFWVQKVLWMKRGYHVFRLKFFVSQCRTTSYRNPLMFH